MDSALKINTDIYELNEKDLGDNLYYYPYKIKYLKKLLNTNIDIDDPKFISTFSSFKGEVYENVIYELLLRYAKESEYITKFILKGPHQNLKENIKNGFAIDAKNQIVYKSGYKDISEFDGLFFVKGGLFFVESTMTKTTASLKKRLKKKKALLEILFPKLQIKALIIITSQAGGSNLFPDYCTVWKTKPINVDKILNNLINSNKKLQSLLAIKDRKFSLVSDLRYHRFQYFNTMLWILNMAIKKGKINYGFLKSKTIDRYFDIFTKLYIGYLELDLFKTIVNNFNLNIENSIVWVSIEKLNTDKYKVVYFAKEKGSKLKRIDIQEKDFILTDKESKGFSTSEYKFLQYAIKPHHKINIDIINDFCKCLKITQCG